MWTVPTRDIRPPRSTPTKEHSMAILNPYLSFRDNARAAMDFYQEVFGGEMLRSTFEEMHASDDPSEGFKIMHSHLTTPSGFAIMAADTPNSMDFTPGTNF